MTNQNRSIKTKLLLLLNKKSKGLDKLPFLNCLPNLPPHFLQALSRTEHTEGQPCPKLRCTLYYALSFYVFTIIVERLIFTQVYVWLEYCNFMFVLCFQSTSMTATSNVNSMHRFVTNIAKKKIIHRGSMEMKFLCILCICDRIRRNFFLPRTSLSTHKQTVRVLISTVKCRHELKVSFREAVKAFYT